MSDALKRTFTKIIRDKLKIGDRRKAARNDTSYRRRAYDPA